jgi:hypothetical protein
MVRRMTSVDAGQLPKQILDDLHPLTNENCGIDSAHAIDLKMSRVNAIENAWFHA